MWLVHPADVTEDPVSFSFIVAVPLCVSLSVIMDSCWCHHLISPCSFNWFWLYIITQSCINVQMDGYRERVCVCIYVRVCVCACLPIWKSLIQSSRLIVYAQNVPFPNSYCSFPNPYLSTTCIQVGYHLKPAKSILVYLILLSTPLLWGHCAVLQCLTILAWVAEWADRYPEGPYRSES